MRPNGPHNALRDKINILVLGVGGNVSQGILKALAISNLSCHVVGACISSRSFGLYTVDKAYVSPTADDPKFLDWLIRVCRTEQIHAVLSGVEPVLAVLAQLESTVRSETGAICLVSPSECLAIGADKLLTCRWLQDRGFAFPRYAAAEDAASVNALVLECGYPLIAKPRHGKGAHGVFMVQSDEELHLVSQREAYVVQEHLGRPDQEYTAACFSDREAKVRGAIVLRRELLEGTTYRAEAGFFPSVRQEAVRIAEALRPVGPCNLQMRIHRDIAVCFEINIRFSGTTSLRARFGFNDVEAALRHYVLGQPAADLPLVTRGIALRYWNEAYLDLEAAAELDRVSQLDQPKRYQITLEDYGISR
jgi:carbamoyl-phosphate synthase large subunit